MTHPLHWDVNYSLSGHVSAGKETKGLQNTDRAVVGKDSRDKLLQNFMTDNESERRAIKKTQKKPNTKGGEEP